MAVNWTNIGNLLGGVSNALSSAGIVGTTKNSILSAFGLAINPNESAELALCSQILLYSTNPAFSGLEAQLEMKLAGQQGIPPAAAALALTLSQTGIDVPTRVSQIEQIIKNGG
jgi:hypothetical protein